jgi:hypothetical protein
MQEMWYKRTETSNQDLNFFPWHSEEADVLFWSPNKGFLEFKNGSEGKVGRKGFVVVVGILGFNKGLVS